MRFDNAFITKNKNVGMQFKNNKNALLTIWDDGKRLHFTEGFTKEETESALAHYNHTKESFRGN